MKEFNLERLQTVGFHLYDILGKAKQWIVRKSVVLRSCGGERMKSRSTEDFQGSENSLYDTIMMDTCHCAFVQTHTMNNTKSEP